MKKAAYFVVLIVGIGGAFLAGAWHDTTGSVPAAGQPPGAAHLHGVPAGPARGSAPPPAGALTISPETQQVVGVRVSPAEKAGATHALRVLGRVAPDETRVYRLNAGIEGSIRDVAAVTTGSQVAKDQVLATFSAPGAVSPILMYITNLGGADRIRQRAAEGSVEAQGASLAASNVRQRLDQLRNIGLSPAQIEEIAQTREIPEAIRIVAPADGIVLARNVSPGLKFERGAEFYRIADLSRVWILADVFENDARHVRPGTRVQVSLPNQGRTLAATVAAVPPQFDAATRTFKVRLEADNPGHVLRPDMFVDAMLPIRLPPAIAVPLDAVVDSGLTKIVFVERAPGVFEPRPVTTGWRFGDRVEILTGLTPGERIVSAGTFLLDSESRLRPPVAGVAASPHAVPAPTGHEHGAHGGAGHGQAAREDAGHGQAAHGGAVRAR